MTTEPTITFDTALATSVNTGYVLSSLANWEPVHIEDYSTTKEVLDLYNPLAELVYAQEMRIRELDEEIRELRSKTTV